MPAPLLHVVDLKTWFGKADRPIRAVDGVSFALEAGQTAALVGESGCGKSVTALSLARLIRHPPGFCKGHIYFDGQDVLQMGNRELLQLRGRGIAYIFQEPGVTLNPVLRVGRQIAEAVRLHQPGVDTRAETLRLMRMVGLPDPDERVEAYPHELSGGMQQRTVIAIALACQPRLLIADEPTTALDVTIQAQILELLRDLQRQLGMALLLITHNLGLVADIAHDVHVMYAGQLVESGPADKVLRYPCHPYTRALLDAVPRLDQDRHARYEGIPGSVPSPDACAAPGCRFADRCRRVEPACHAKEPPWNATGPASGARCHFAASPHRTAYGERR
jgi:peptide/nickel transport system ATP-binding protein